ncbi:MAG: hypothetical protein IT318_19275 [Anaerolineales bacterium]|nr:hypothetical protein [Anaerolineales bacterium]
MPLLLLLAARLALGLAYSQVVPIWESYDEDGHFAYARYLAVHGTLALDPNDPEAVAIWERFQPPLYYNLVAPLIARYDLGRRFELPERNPHFVAGDAGVNYALHPLALSGPKLAIERAVRMARALSVAISTLSVVVVFLAARRLWPRDPAVGWAATSLYAFWPQFLFVGSMVSNDVLVTALSAAALLLALRLALDGFHLGRALLLALAVGAGLLAKLNAVGLIPLALAALALSLLPGPGRAARWRPSQIVLGLGGLALLAAGALGVLSSLDFVTGQVLQLATLSDFIRNLDPGGEAGGAGGLVSAALPYAFRTYYASFGWGNLETAGWLYWLWSAGAALGAAGLAVSGYRAWRRAGGQNGAWRAYLLMGLLLASILGLTLALAIAHGSIHLVPGRYLLPTLPAVIFLLVAGWRALLPRGAPRRWAWRGLGAGAALAGWAIVLWTLIPAYARPAPLLAGAADVETPQALFFNRQIELLGYNGPERAVAGEPLRLALCWQAVAPVAENYTLFLEVVGADNQGYGRLQTYPGRGNYPTSAWRLNEPFCDDYVVEMGANIPAPALSRLRVAWRDDATGRALPVETFAGELLPDPEISLQFKVSTPDGYRPEIANPVSYAFGSTSLATAPLRLTGYALAAGAGEARVILRWEARAPLPGNYMVFVHLRDMPDDSYAQGDSLPLGGAYPTWLWQPGEIVLDPHVLELPAGSSPTPPLDLYVGLYDVDTNQRLPAFDAGGAQLPNDEIILERGIRLP